MRVTPRFGQLRITVAEDAPMLAALVVRGA